MTLYSLNNTRPAPLPFRITLPNGFTRTDPSTFTPEEIQAAGFTGPYTEPPYDPATEQLDWIDGEYVVSPLPPPPPQPDWRSFKSGVLTSADVAQIMAVARANSCEPAATALPVALEKAIAGDYSEFAACWSIVATGGNAQPQEIAALVAAAEACNLPPEFVATLTPAHPAE